MKIVDKTHALTLFEIQTAFTHPFPSWEGEGVPGFVVRALAR